MFSDDFDDLPDPDYIALTTWTYIEMSAEFGRMVKRFAAMGISEEEACSYALTVCSLESFAEFNTSSFTENVMARTLDLKYRLSHGLALSEGMTNKSVYNDFAEYMEKYRDSHYSGYELSENDKELLERDLQYVFDGLENKFYDERDLHNFDDREEIDIEGCFVGADAVMLTDKVREFIDRYDGKSFELRLAHFVIDMPFSEVDPDIFTVSVTDSIAVKDDNFYLGCIFFGSEYDLENADMYIDKYGRLYDAGVYGTLTAAAESMEDFISLYEEQRRINEAVIEERIRIENKYFAPEIRTASI